MAHWQSVLRPGDWVHFDGGEHQVVALTGTSVRLCSSDGAQMVVLATHLMSAPDFGVIDAAPPPQMTPFGLLDTLPAPVLAAAREWERHIVEITTGVAPEGIARPEYDPAARTQIERDRAKAAELAAAGRPLGVRTLQRMRGRYAEQGLWGLVDQRVLRECEPTGRVDERVVAVVRQELDAQTDVSTGTRSRLIRRVRKSLEDTYGPGVVPLPGRSTFYNLIEALATGRHSFGSAVTRRQTANRPARPFTPTLAARPGEQVQIDSTPLDVMVQLEAGVVARADLTIAVDVATRTICAGVLRPIGTKAVDAALLLARMLVPEPMRPGWASALAMSASRLPHDRLLSIDARMAKAAAKPVIVPDTIVIDGGHVFISETFTRACERLGISVQRARKRTPTDKAVVEATFGSINTLWCQHLRGYTGSNTTRRGERVEADAVWTVPQLQDLLDEWLIAGWQTRRHDSLRDPDFPRRALSPNEAYASLVAVAGYLPVTLTGDDYRELLPVTWRAINDYGIRIDYRTYDAKGLEPYRRESSGVAAKKGLWEVHYDPYDLSQVFVRTPDGWVSAEWTHKPMVTGPFADFTWREARRRVAERGADDTDEAAIARALDDLLSRCEHGPVTADDRSARRAAARGRVAASTHRPPPVEPGDEPRETASTESLDDGDPVRDLRCRCRSRKVDMTRTRKPTRRRKPAYTPVATVNTIEVPPDSPLTTKEGWAAFVRHTPQPPQSLTASPLMAMSPKDRARHEDRLRDYHADLPLVNTPTIQKVISTGRLLIQLNRRQISARRGMVISGMSGTGKTTALTQLGRAHELAIRRRFPDDGDRLPVIYVTVPPAATPRMLAVEFARFLGLEFPARANVTDITDAVCSVAAHTRVDLVLVDEIHNISLATRAGAEVSDQLKYFAERLPATFIYAGVEVEAQGLFAGARGRQIAGRFTVVAAVPFAYGTAEQRANWHALVAAVESTLRLRDHVAGTLPEMAEQLYRRSRGMIGSLSQLVRGAAILAIDDGTEKITAELLDLVPVDYAAQRCDNPIRASRLVGDTTAL